MNSFLYFAESCFNVSTMKRFLNSDVGPLQWVFCCSEGAVGGGCCSGGALRVLLVVVVVLVVL